MLRTGFQLKRPNVWKQVPVKLLEPASKAEATTVHHVCTVQMIFQNEADARHPGYPSM